MDAGVSIMKNKRLLSSALALALAFSATAVIYTAKRHAESDTVLRLAILTDVHYLSSALVTEAGDSALTSAAEDENRMIRESDGLLTQAVAQLKASKDKPDIMLVCGDLTSNGEAENAKGVAEKLKDAEKTLGADIYVINGNHDINNSYAADFRGEKVACAERLLPGGSGNTKGFREIFAELGYDDESVFFGSEPGAAAAASGALSYVRRIADGVTLIALDSNIYSNDLGARYGEAQRTAGEITPELLEWAAAQAREASARGDLVLAICHHAIVPHYDQILDGKSAVPGFGETADPETTLLNLYFSDYIVKDWRTVATTLADAGVAAVFTGHSHINDIAGFTTDKGNTIYDIETASLCAYPCAYRQISVTRHGRGADRSWSFDIRTEYIRSLTWTDPATGEQREIEDLQAYSYERHSLTAEKLNRVTGRLLRQTLHSIALYHNSEYGDGAEGWLRDKLDLPRTVSWLEALEAAAAKWDGKTGTFHVLLMDIPYALSCPDGTDTLRIDLRYGLGSEHEYSNVITLDLSKLPDVITEMTDILTEEAKKAENQETNYESDDTEFQAELSTLAGTVIDRLFDVTLVALPDGKRAEKEDCATLAMILSDAYQALSMGDEMKAAAETAEQRLVWRGLLTGSSMTGAARDAVEALIDGLTVEEDETALYPALYRMVDHSLDGFCTVEPEESFASVFLSPYSGLKTLPDALRAASLATKLIDDELLRPLTSQLEITVQYMTEEHNTPEDSVWSFRYVPPKP